MLNNEFYRGVLAEVYHEKIAQASTQPIANTPSPPNKAPASGTSAPVLKPPAPSPAPAAPSPAAGNPVVQSNPFNTIAPDLRKKVWPTLSQYVNTPVNQISGRLQQDAGKVGIMDYIKGILMKGERLLGGEPIRTAANTDNPLQKATQSYVSENPVNAYGNLNQLKKVIETLKQKTPSDQVNTLYDFAQSDPEAKQFIDTTRREVINHEVQGAKTLGELFSMGSKYLGGSSNSSATQGTSTDAPQDTYAQALMKRDPSIKDDAVSAFINRGGDLMGSWLKDNWGKLALGVGGVGSLIYLIKNLMSDNEEQKQVQPTMQQTGPQFL